MTERAGSQPSDPSAPDSTGEGSAYVTSLSEHLAKLQKENIAIGDQNQQLAASLRDASTYNQVLGFDLYQLDQEIGDLETRLSQSRSRIREIENQTKEITKQADACKNALLKDPEFAKLAKRLRSLQRTHSSATSNLEELRGILGDSKFSMLDGALQLMQEKVHFLYWSNTELHQQIELMQQLLKEGQESSVIRGELDKMKNISDLKLEWLQMRLYEEKMKQGKSRDDDTDTDDEVVEKKRRKRRDRKKKGNEEEIEEEEERRKSGKSRKRKRGSKKVETEDEESFYDYDDGSEEERGKNEKGHTVKRKRKKAKDDDGEYHEYEYEYDYDDIDQETNKPKKTKKKVKSRKKKASSGIGYRDITDPKTGQSMSVRMTMDEDQNRFEYRKTKDDDGNLRTTRRQLNDDGKGYKHYKRPVPGKEKAKRIRWSKVFKDGDSWEYEYEYDNDDDKPTRRRLPEADSDGFVDSYDPKTGEPVKMRIVRSSKDEAYLDILRTDPDTKAQRCTRTICNPRTKEPRRRHCDMKGGRANGRRSRVRNNNGEEYEYEYEYDDNETRTRKNLVEEVKKHELEPIIIASKPRVNPERFAESVDPKTGTKVMKRTVKAEDGVTYCDTQEEDGRKVKRRALEKDGKGFLYETVTDPETGKKLRRRTTRVQNANDDEYDYEYECEYDDDDFEAHAKKTRKEAAPGRDPICKKLSKGRQIIDDEHDKPKKQICQEIDPLTGEKVEMELGDGNENEFVLTSKGKPMKLKMKGTDGGSRHVYAVVVDPKQGNKALRRRTVKMISNNDMALEYDDSDIDSETGKPKRRIRQLVTGDGLKPDHNGFYLRFEGNELVKVRHADGEKGTYKDVMKVDPSTEKIVIKRQRLRGEYEKKPGKNGETVRARRSRCRNVSGDDHEYEYEYDDENDKVKRNEVENADDEVLDKIDYIPNSDDERKFLRRWRNAGGFKEETDPETGEKKLRRIVKGKDGKTYEDTLEIGPDGEQKIVRQPLDGEKKLYEKTKQGKVRAIRVQHDNMSEHEYEYQYEDESDSEEEACSKQKRSKSQETLFPIGLDPRPDADGFIEEIDPETGEIIRARIVKGKNGVFYKDIKRTDAKNGKERIERRQTGKDGASKSWKKKRNPKTGKVYRTRRTRYRNDNGDEYEYEYQYDDEEKDEATGKSRCNRQRIRKEKENIDEIGAGQGFEEIIDPKTGKKRKVRRVIGENGETYLDELVTDEATGDAKIKRKKVEGDEDKCVYEEWEDDGEKKRIRRSRSHHVQRGGEQEYEYEYDTDGNYSRRAIDERDDRIDIIVPGSTRLDRDEAIEKYVIRFVGDDGNTYEDIMTIEPDGRTHIVRRQIDKDGDGYAYKKKRHPKSGKVFRTRRSRHQNDDGDEYEYEYQYDEDDVLRRRRLAANKESIAIIGNIPEFDEKKKLRKNLLDVDESTFTEQIDPETGVVILVRRVEGEDGNLYEDVLFLDPLKKERKVVRRPIGKDGETFQYGERENLKGANVMTRHSRYRNERGEEYEYDYEYDEETEEGETIRLRRMIDNVDEESIEPISKMPNRMRHRRRVHDSSHETSALRVEGSPHHDGATHSDHLAMALFLSEDKRMQVRKAGGEVVDLSEYENEASTSHVNPLSHLIPRLRAEKEMGSGEELAGTLRVLEEEIEQRTAIRDRLKAQIDEMTKPPGHKKRKRLAFSGIRSTNVSAPPDPVKMLALTEFNRRNTAAQTECTNDTINYQLSVLEQQKVERKAAEDLQSSLEILQKKIATTKEMIEDAKRDGELKEEKIKELKTEIGNVKEELGRDDENALKEEERAREYAQELDKVDQQIRSKQQQLEKVNSQVGALQMHLKEMQRFRMLLESELNDIYNRERPEIRQLIDDVKTFRTTIDETANKVAQMYKRVEAKRQAMEKLANSEEMRQYNDLRMERVNLERRVKKWTTLVKDSRESLQALESFSAVNATRRQQIAQTLKNKERQLMEKEAEVEELERYAGLLEAMIREHKTNWV